MKAKLSSSTQSWKNSLCNKQVPGKRGTPVRESKSWEPNKEKEGSRNSTPVLRRLAQRLVTDPKDWLDPANAGLGHPQPHWKDRGSSWTHKEAEKHQAVFQKLQDRAPPSDQQVVSDRWKGPPI